MDHYSAARASIVKHLTGSIKDTPIFFEGEIVKKVGKFYLFSFLPAGDSVATMGAVGQDEHHGLAQVDCYSLAKLGPKASNEMLANARKAFNYSAQQDSVRITNIDIKRILIDENQYSRSIISIYYKYRIGRGK